MLAVSLVPITIRLALLPILPIPAPSIHDEFSNLLTARTFMLGRLTNPTPPFWVHFETFHELMQPTYSGIMPPGMGLFLALSTLVFGHPWWGICISVVLMCLTTLWMLRPWFPPVWALLGGLLVGLQFGIVHYWVNGYWGGTLAAIGGSLVVGAYGRLRKSIERAPSIAAYGAGAALLSCTRPYEGAVLFLTVTAALIWSLRSSPCLGKTFAQLALSLGVLTLPVVGFMALQNRAVTGSMFDMPHELFRRQYATIPTFFWQPRQQPMYHHKALRDFFYQWEADLEDAQQWGTLVGLLPGIWGRLKASGHFVPHAMYFPVALLSLLAALLPRMRFFGLCLATAIAANALVNWFTPHYFAPVLGCMIGIHIEFLRYARTALRRSRFGSYVFPGLIACLIISFALRIYSKSNIPEDKRWAYQRQEILRKLDASNQGHLIYVRYTPSHDPLREWVFNGPDLNGEKVIWARQMSRDSDRALIKAFSDRIIWILEPDTSVQLRPYDGN
jgi:hypothetical protein